MTKELKLKLKLTSVIHELVYIAHNFKDHKKIEVSERKAVNKILEIIIETMLETGFKSIWEAHRPKKWIRTNETTIGDWTEP